MDRQLTEERLRTIIREELEKIYEIPNRGNRVSRELEDTSGIHRTENPEITC